MTISTIIAWGLEVLLIWLGLALFNSPVNFWHVAVIVLVYKSTLTAVNNTINGE